MIQRRKKRAAQQANLFVLPPQRNVILYASLERAHSLLLTVTIATKLRLTRSTSAAPWGGSCGPFYTANLGGGVQISWRTRQFVPTAQLHCLNSESSGSLGLSPVVPVTIYRIDICGPKEECPLISQGIRPFLKGKKIGCAESASPPGCGRNLGCRSELINI